MEMDMKMKREPLSAPCDLFAGKVAGGPIYYGYEKGKPLPVEGAHPPGCLRGF